MRRGIDRELNDETVENGGDWKEAWRQAFGMWKDRDDIDKLYAERRRRRRKRRETTIRSDARRIAVPLLFDTNILIDFLRGREQAMDLLNAQTEPPTISVVSVMELYAGVREPTRGTGWGTLASAGTHPGSH